MEGLFQGLGVTKLDLRNVDFSNVTNMSYMFDGCINLNAKIFI